MADQLRTGNRRAVVRASALAVVTAALAVSAALSAFANVTRLTSPERALAVEPNNAVALASLADILLLARGGNAARNGMIVREYALRSLSSNSLNPSALRQLALSNTSIVRGRSARLLGLSEKLSRREFGTQLILIERAVQEGNLDGALLHYDIALRGSPKSQDVLFPILLDTFGDPEIREALAPYIKASPPWAMNFLAYATANAPRPSAVVSLVGRAGGVPKARGATEIEDALLSALVARREFGAAKDYYLTLPGSDPVLLSSPTFDLDEGRRRAGPLEWLLTESSTTGATVLPDGGIQLFGASGESGIAASKILFLPPGHYNLASDFGPTNMPAGSSLQWKLRCLGMEKDETAWQGVNFRPMANKSLSEAFTIAEGCSISALDLYMSGGTGQESAEADLGSVKLSRVGASRDMGL